MEKLVGPIAEKAPQVLFHEDAHGKTPFDLAIEKQLHGFIEYLMSSYTRDRRWQSTSPLVHWPLFAFGKDYQGPMQTRDPYKTWEIIQEMIKSMEPQQSPRKLVTQTEWEEIAQLYVWGYTFFFIIRKISNTGLDQRTKNCRRIQKGTSMMWYHWLYTNLEICAGKTCQRYT